MLRKAPWAISSTTAALFLMLAVGLATAGTTGKLSGKVTNEKKEPLAGVNIRIEGQRLGALSDEQGNYVIIGVLAGDYIVRANLLGHAPFVAQNVKITPDFSTELNMQLKTEAVQLTEVRVDAERPLLQKDATSTSRFISGEDIARLPTRGYQDAAAQQSGIVNFQRTTGPGGLTFDREPQNGSTLIVRGGRPNETAYYVDGFSQQDPLTGYSTTSINNSAIEEIVVLNGGFNAEYGRIMSGVVNVITRAGGSRYSGSVEAVTDNFAGKGEDFVGSKVYDYNLYDANFGGPLVIGRDWGSFFLSGQRRWQGDRSPLAIYDRPLPGNTLGGWTGQAKLSLPVAKQINLSVGALGSEDDWRRYLNSYRYNLAHTPRVLDNNRSVTSQLTHTLSSKAFYSLGGSWFFTERKMGDGLFFDDLARYAAQPQADIESIRWFWPGTSDLNSDLGRFLAESAQRQNGGVGHIFNNYIRRQSSYWAVKGDYTSQISPYHQVKTGGQFDRHTLRYYQHYNPNRFPSSPDLEFFGFSGDAREDVDTGIDKARHPTLAGYYLQDKYERAGLVVNAGLRWDYIDSNTPAVAREDSVLGPDQTLTDEDLRDSKTYSRISPRFGIGFPVTDRTVLHANWGKFFQLPNLQDLYPSYTFLNRIISRGGYFVTVGNPNLKPEQTTGYEVGVNHQLNEFAKFDLVAYYKDVKDLVQVKNQESDPHGFATYRNSDYATIKGIDLGFQLRRINHVTANVAYSLSYAVGTGSVSNSQRNIAWTGDDDPKQTSPLDFDQRHKLSVNLDYSLGKDEGPTWGGSQPFENVGINVLYNVGSGTPFTPTNVYDEVSLASLASNPIAPLNSRYGPWTQTVDLKAGKSFGWSGLNMNAFVWVLNAFDTDNAIAVFSSTGNPFTTSYLNSNEGRDVADEIRGLGLDPDQVYGEALQAPGLWTNPRMVRFGLSLGF